MCGKCQESVEQNTEYVAAANLPKEVTKEAIWHIGPVGLFNENFVKFMISQSI